MNITTRGQVIGMCLAYVLISLAQATLMPSGAMAAKRKITPPSCQTLNDRWARYVGTFDIRFSKRMPEKGDVPMRSHELAERAFDCPSPQSRLAENLYYLEEIEKRNGRYYPLYRLAKAIDILFVVDGYPPICTQLRLRGTNCPYAAVYRRQLSQTIKKKVVVLYAPPMRLVGKDAITNQKDIGIIKGVVAVAHEAQHAKTNIGHKPCARGNDHGQWLCDNYFRNGQLLSPRAGANSVTLAVLKWFMVNRRSHPFEYRAVARLTCDYALSRFNRMTQSQVLQSACIWGR